MRGLGILATSAMRRGSAATFVGAASAEPDTLTVTCGVSGQAQPPPCNSAAWYTSPVSVVWQRFVAPGLAPHRVSAGVTTVYDSDR